MFTFLPCFAISKDFFLNQQLLSNIALLISLFCFLGPHDENDWQTANNTKIPNSKSLIYSVGA